MDGYKRHLSFGFSLWIAVILWSFASSESLAASLQWGGGPNTIKLGEWVHVAYSYQDVGSDTLLNVQLTGTQGEWFGGYRQRLQEGHGKLQVGFRVEVPIGYNGELYFTATLKQREGFYVSQSVQSPRIYLSQDPSYAVGALCAPQQVTQSQPFHINAWYTLRKARPIDVHIDVLNAQSKEWYAGALIPMSEQQGQVSATLILPERAQGELLWKIFTTARGEPFPNFLAESGLLIPLGDKLKGDCSIINNSGKTPSLPAVDFLIMSKNPERLIKGQKAWFEMSYDLVSYESAELTLSLLNVNTQQVYAGTKMDIHASDHTVGIEIPIPWDLQKPFYVIAYMSPRGGSWENSIAEDRLYTLSY